MSSDRSVERIMNGKSWADFCDALKTAGDIVLGPDSPQVPLERAEGWRYLARLARGGLAQVEGAEDPMWPHIGPPARGSGFGAANPDGYYQSAAISGRHDYRIRGDRGTVSYFSMGAFSGSYLETGQGARAGYLSSRDLAVNADGTFEIILSCNQHPGNWLRLEPESSRLSIRQNVLDPKTEEFAKLVIERVGAEGQTPPPPSPLTPERMDQALSRAGAFVVGTAKEFQKWVDIFYAGPNDWHALDLSVRAAIGGDPNIYFFHGYWELGPNEALVVEFMPPECVFWNFQLNNYWFETLDFERYKIAVSKENAAYRPDGSVRIVVAAKDPGVENWVDTAGHSVGTMTYRMIGADHYPKPSRRNVNWEGRLHL